MERAASGKPHGHSGHASHGHMSSVVVIGVSIQQWKLLDRSPRKVGKEARSVYKHTKLKGKFSPLDLVGVVGILEY